MMEVLQNKELMKYVLMAVGAVIFLLMITTAAKFIKRRKKAKEQEHQAQRRMREEALDRALANPMGKTGSAEAFEKQRRPFKVEYSQGEDAGQDKGSGKMFEITEVNELSKRKYMFRCREVVAIGNQYGSTVILPGNAEEDQVYCQIFFYEGANYVRTTGKVEVSLKRKGKRAVVNRNGIRLQTNDTIYVGKTAFQITFLQ